MLTLINKLRIDEAGTTAVEYGLIAGLISVAGLVAFIALGDSLNVIFDLVSSTMNANASTQ